MLPSLNLRAYGQPHISAVMQHNTEWWKEEVTVLISSVPSPQSYRGQRRAEFLPAPPDRLADVLSFIDPELNGHYRNSRNIPASENPLKTQQITLIPISLVN